MAETTSEAREQIARARGELSTEVDELESAVRSAVDIPAKIRRNPGRVAALGGGAVFLAAGGPKRVARRVARLVRPAKPAPVSGLLPVDIARRLEEAGEGGEELRSALEQEFADWLEENRAGAPKPKKGERRTGSDTFWHLFDTVSSPIAAQGAKQFAQRLFAAEPDRPRTGGDADEGGMSEAGTGKGQQPPSP